MEDLNVGLIVRCDNRGLGNQTWEVYRHLPYDKVLVLRDPGSERQGFEPHPERFPDGQVTFFGRYGEGMVENECREFLDGLDVVYSAETYYDWRFCDWAKEMGVATVLHSNPEFYFHWREPKIPHPTAWWSATNWRSGNMPPGTRVVPMPVPLDRWDAPDFDNNPRQVLHIGGLEAILDRNGTGLVTQVAEMMDDVEFLVTMQGRKKNKFTYLRDTANYWEMYQNDAPLMLMPRRYGGLSLPTIEAIGAGKLVLMTDTDPNREWPIYPLPCSQQPQQLETQGGGVDLFQCDVNGMKNSIAHLLDSGELPKLRRGSYEWAVRNSWENMIEMWEHELRLAADAR